MPAMPSGCGRENDLGIFFSGSVRSACLTTGDACGRPDCCGETLFIPGDSWTARGRGGIDLAPGGVTGSSFTFTIFKVGTVSSGFESTNAFILAYSIQAKRVHSNSY